MAMLKTGTWVLVADSEKALFLENVGDTRDYKLKVRRKETHDNPPSREQGANRPGRYNDGPNVQKSAMDDTDWHELEKERFAEDLAEMLYRRAHKGEFKQIVLVAAPHTLGHLRPALHPEVTRCVIGEIPKNLTNEPIEKMEAHIHEALER
ncbi:Host attachment protein [Rhodobacteraceae bacterium 2CG4]|uniref:Host attachment protein n=1 Tax=Halovulum marinum TaxID=2662447 RepID=A0A6L5YVC5_9RHOB|nr:host attachment family protein [Halovulum marinum]MSU88293.1 Host attachment protein [Halovulum marinum]